MSKHIGEKCGKLAEGDPDGRRVGLRTYEESDGRRRKVTTLELDLQYIKRKSNAKFQLNMSKLVGEKWGNCTFPIF